MKTAWLIVGGLTIATTFAACFAARATRPGATDAGVQLGDRQENDVGIPIERDDSEDYDAGYNPFIGKWKYLPGNPINCKVRIAEEPAQSVTPLKFEPCKSRPSCTRLVVDWWSNPLGALSFPGAEPVRLINGKPYVNLLKEYPTNEYVLYKIARISVVLPIDGAPVFAAGTLSPPGAMHICPFATTHTSGGIALHALPRPYQGWDFFGWSSWQDPTNLDSVTFPHFPTIPCDLCQDLIASGNTLACGCDNPSYTVLFDEIQRKVILPGSPGPILQAWPINPSVVDGFLSSNFSSVPGSFDLVRRDGTHATLVRPVANAARWIAVDRSDGERFAWVEIAGDDFGPFTDGVLWTAPYATSEASLTRRRVARLPTITNRNARHFVVNAGVAVQTTSDKTVLMTRLSDGWSWSIDAEPEDRFNRALWVDEKEVWIAVEAAASQRMWSIVRIDRASLGSPTIAPGL